MIAVIILVLGIKKLLRSSRLFLETQRIKTNVYDSGILVAKNVSEWVTVYGLSLGVAIS